MSTLTSITGLQNLTNLTAFRADYNSLTSVDLSGLANLTFVDISDNDLPGTNINSLTSVNLTGCTALQDLRLDDSNFSAGIPSFAGLNSLQNFDMDQCNITGALDISQLSALTTFDLSGNTGITSVQLPEAYLTDVNISNGALTQTAVDNILNWIDGSTLNNGYLYLDGGTNAVPSETGLTNKASLISKGWQVSVNEVGNV